MSGILTSVCQGRYWPDPVSLFCLWGGLTLGRFDTGNLECDAGDFGEGGVAERMADRQDKTGRGSWGSDRGTVDLTAQEDIIFTKQHQARNTLNL